MKKWVPQTGGDTLKGFGAPASKPSGFPHFPDRWTRPRTSYILASVTDEAAPSDVTKARQALIHELANAVAILTANVEMLAGGFTKPDEVDLVLADMSKASKRALRLLEDLRRLG